MILADTNIIINLINNPSEEDISILSNRAIATCGVIKTELHRGIHSNEETKRINEIVDDLDYLPFNESDWMGLADLFVTLRRSGINVPFQDGIIAYLAIRNKCTLWTQDKHFALIKKVFNELELLEVA